MGMNLEYGNYRDVYFDREMSDEFYTEIARRDAMKIMKRLDTYKKCAMLERHLAEKQMKINAGS